MQNAVHHIYVTIKEDKTNTKSNKTTKAGSKSCTMLKASVKMCFKAAF